MSSAHSGDLPASFEEIAVALAHVSTDIDFALDVDDHQAFEDACRERGVLLDLRWQMLGAVRPKTRPDVGEYEAGPPGAPTPNGP